MDGVLINMLLLLLSGAVAEVIAGAISRLVRRNTSLLNRFTYMFQRERKIGKENTREEKDRENLITEIGTVLFLVRYSKIPVVNVIHILTHILNNVLDNGITFDRHKYI